MDVLLNLADEYLLDRVYAHFLPLAPKATAATIIPAALSTNGTFVNGTVAAVATPAPAAWSKVLPILSAGKDTLLGAPGIPFSAGVPLASSWPRDYLGRQVLSLTAVTMIGIHLLYFIFSYASYRWIFNHDMMKHPRFLKNQVRQEIMCSLRAFPGMMALTLPWFVAEVRGYSRLYDNVDEYGWPWLIASIFIFLFFTDFCIYWIHRLEHHPSVYKYVHKPHHKWIVPTPFAAYAFHPLDGYLQSLPYHAIVFVLPFHNYVYLGLFVFVNLWTVLIHDSDLITGHPLENIINGPAHHTLHHLYFTVNYGQYFTWADRAGGSYRQPDPADDPIHEVNKVLEKEGSKKVQ